VGAGVGKRSIATSRVSLVLVNIPAMINRHRIDAALAPR